ncbi:hypothetical protein TNCV_4232591 [Trichonephila clavipes]|nr:hypothetical protein TNCV_4232591 [Trichonephila clavipes]
MSSSVRNVWFPHFRHGQLTMNMNSYTNSELADIHFYELANGNGRVALRLYGKKYPTRWQPNHQMFTRLHQNLLEHGSFRATIDDTPCISLPPRDASSSSCRPVGGKGR